MILYGHPVSNYGTWVYPEEPRKVYQIQGAHHQPRNDLKGIDSDFLIHTIL